MMSRFYFVLRDGEPVPAESMDEVSKCFEDIEARRVAVTKVGRYEVSTVFLVMNHSLHSEVPILFETMVFPQDDFSPFNSICERYSTRSEALEGHAEVVANVKAALGIQEGEQG